MGDIGITTTGGARGVALSERTSGQDPETVLLKARQQRVEILQSRLDERSAHLETALDESKSLGSLQAKLGQLLKDGPNRDSITRLLRDLPEAEIRRLGGYCVVDGEAQLRRMGCDDVHRENWEKFGACAAADAAKLDHQVDALKADVRELSNDIGHELKAMQRSLRTDQRSRQAVFGGE